jgi:ubiquitin-conjugating enzyme E2 variant
MEMSYTIASTVGWIATCYLSADFLTGVVHWAEDTWLAPGRSRLLDRYVVLDNIEHHRRPGSIRGGSYWGTNAPSLIVATIAIALLAVFDVQAWQPYLILIFASQGNQIHKWAHSSERPAIVRWLQAIGVFQSRAHHGKHHARPYAVHFCALSNYLNPILDGIGFWIEIERIAAGFGATVQRGSQARGGL